jgi:hypothetical protein
VRTQQGLVAARARDKERVLDAHREQFKEYLQLRTRCDAFTRFSTRNWKGRSATRPIAILCARTPGCWPCGARTIQEQARVTCECVNHHVERAQDIVTSEP